MGRQKDMSRDLPTPAHRWHTMPDEWKDVTHQLTASDDQGGLHLLYKGVPIDPGQFRFVFHSGGNGVLNEWTYLTVEKRIPG
jgi:hypothetical protein